MKIQEKGNTSVVSFSIDLPTLIFLDEYAQRKGGLTRSMVIRHFLRLGRTYEKIIDEQLENMNRKLKTANGVSVSEK